MFASEMYVLTFVKKHGVICAYDFTYTRIFKIVECFESAVPPILSYAPTFFPPFPPPPEVSLKHSRNYTFSMFVSVSYIKVEDTVLAFRLLPIALPKLTIKIQKLKFVCSLLGVFGGYCSAVFFKSIFTLECKRKILVFLFLKCFTPRPN